MEMSGLESMLIGKVLGSDNSKFLLNELQTLNRNIETQISLRAKPEILLSSGRSAITATHTADIEILKGFEVPRGFRATVKDYNINWTSSGGKVGLVIMDRSNNIVSTIIEQISASVSGAGGTVLEEGQKLALVGHTSGAGVLGCHFSGELQRI